MKSENLKLPWSVKDTIENLKEIKEHLKTVAKRTNLHGKGEEDAKEIDFDFDRAIESLEKQESQRWIPCSDKLPEKEGFYLISIKPIDFLSGDLRTKIVWFSEMYNDFMGFGSLAIAWMPLPAPYENEE